MENTHTHTDIQRIESNFSRLWVCALSPLSSSGRPPPLHLHNADCGPREVNARKLQPPTRIRCAALRCVRLGWAHKRTHTHTQQVESSLGRRVSTAGCVLAGLNTDDGRRALQSHAGGHRRRHATSRNRTGAAHHHGKSQLLGATPCASQRQADAASPV